MKSPDAETTKILEAMKMEAAYVDWVAEKEAIHDNNYRALFEASALEPLMQFHHNNYRAAWIWCYRTKKTDRQVRSWHANIFAGCTGTIEGSQLPCCGICLAPTAAVKQKNSLPSSTSDSNSSQPEPLGTISPWTEGSSGT
jgi:hypothetical protein